jgi:hypothetical protein
MNPAVSVPAARPTRAALADPDRRRRPARGGTTAARAVRHANAATRPDTRDQPAQAAMAEPPQNLARPAERRSGAHPPGDTAFLMPIATA